MRMSFVLLTHARADHLLRCLESLERAGAPALAEAVVAFNGAKPGMDALHAELPARFPWVKTLRLDKTCRGEARNQALAKASGELLYFLDDDTIVPEGFVTRVLETFDRNPEAPVVGGPNIGPDGAAAFPRAVDFLLRSPLGAGPMCVRHERGGTDRPAPGWAFTLCNLGARRAVFDEHRLRFPARCASAEENLFLHHVEKRVGSPVLSPGLFVYHERRAGPASFLRQVFASGRGRMQITRAEPSSLQPVALAPAAFALYLATLSRLPAVGVAPALLYGGACAGEALRLAFFERDPAAAAWLAPLLPLAHLAYAAGTAAGIFSEIAAYSAEPRAEEPAPLTPA